MRSNIGIWIGGLKHLFTKGAEYRITSYTTLEQGTLHFSKLWPAGPSIYTKTILGVSFFLVLLPKLQKLADELKLSACTLGGHKISNQC